MKLVEFKVGRNAVACKGFTHDDLSAVCSSYQLRPFVVVCPGGGYVHLSPREAEPVAMKFYAHGMNTFILYYSIGEAIRKEKPYRELGMAMEYIKEHSAELGCDFSKSAVMGFSAGGHVAASFTVFAQAEFPSAVPSLSVLGYPVISSGPFAHRGSFESLCDNEEEWKLFSLENRVDHKLCPIFLFHTSNDETVPVENSLMLASALSAQESPYTLHIYQDGKHGFATATKEVGSCYPELQGWCEEVLHWMFYNWGWEE